MEKISNIGKLRDYTNDDLDIWNEPRRRGRKPNKKKNELVETNELETITEQDKSSLIKN